MGEASVWGIELLIASWFLYFGASIGSFANVVAWRLPRGLPIGAARSHCPKCDARIRFTDNIPIISWFWLRGRCRYCRAPISPRYVVVEFLFGLIFLGLYLVELRTGGANLGRNALHRHDPFSFLRWNDTELLSLYVYHVTALSLLATASLMRWDGDRPPHRFIIFSLLAGIIPPLFIPWLRCFDIPIESPLIDRWVMPFAGVVIALCLETILAVRLRLSVLPKHRSELSNVTLFTGLVIVGSFFPWQIVLASTLSVALLSNLIGLAAPSIRRFPPVVISCLIWICLVIAFWQTTIAKSIPTNDESMLPAFLGLGVLMSIPLLLRALLREPGNCRPISSPSPNTQRSAS